MKISITKIVLMLFLTISQNLFSLSSGDVSVRLISGYFWLDNSCTVGGPLGKVVSFRIKNTKGSLLQGVSIDIGNISFTATGAASYTSGTPSFTVKTSKTVYIGNIAAGDSATAFFYVGYNCLTYPNNTNITTDYLTLPVTIKDVNTGTVTSSPTKNIYVIRNSNNNTITVLATTANLVGTMLTLSVAYNISNVKPGNIIDMELSTTSAFPAGYSIIGCKITASSIPTDFPVNMTNTHYINSITSNLPSGGTVTIEWYLKISGASSGITSTNIIPYVVSDAGSSQRWQANTTSFTGTSTPTNSLTISKRVNQLNVSPNDTVRYTIVIKNTSSVADITIDKLVDDLPRDYKFLYMETNTSVFPRLVTYTNCTAYPVYQDTNYLYFYGQKEISSGVFSWVVPKNDSIKLIYSAKVSSLAGSNDTNFISAYVGSSSVGTAFAKVNVLSSLPISILYFNVEKNQGGLELSWASADNHPNAYFNVYRESANGGFVKIGESIHQGENSSFYYSCLDKSIIETNPTYVVYKLELVNGEGIQGTYFASIDLSRTKADFSVVKVDADYFGIGNINPGIHKVFVAIHDVSGKVLYSGDVHRTDSIFIVPYSLSLENGTCVFLSVETTTGMTSKKIIIQ